MLLKTLRPGVGACLLAGCLSAAAHAQTLASVGISHSESVLIAQSMVQRLAAVDVALPAAIAAKNSDAVGRLVLGSAVAQNVTTATMVNLVITENPNQANSSLQ